MTSLNNGFPCCATTDGRRCSSLRIADRDHANSNMGRVGEHVCVRHQRFRTAPVSSTDIILITVMAAAYAWRGRDDESLFVKQMR